MKKIKIGKIKPFEIDALVNNLFDVVILCKTTTTRPVVTYDAETKTVVFGASKHPVDFFTYEEIAENINDKTRNMLKATYQKVEDCGEYFEVTEYEPTDNIVEIDGVLSV